MNIAEYICTYKILKTATQECTSLKKEANKQTAKEHCEWQEGVCAVK